MSGQLGFQTSGNTWITPVPSTPSNSTKHLNGLQECNRNAPVLERFEQQMCEYHASHESIIRKIQRSYVLSDDCSVLEFLAEHRALPELLIQAVPYLRKYFGEDAVLTLKAPGELAERTLYGAICWPGRLREAADALARFDEDWWMARGQAAGYLTFTYDLV